MGVFGRFREAQNRDDAGIAMRKNGGPVIALLADPAVQIASLTITEKGYGYDPASGGLDRAHPDIAADLKDDGVPQSAMGFILAGLAARRQAGTPPFTVLSCDNLPSNGQVARQVLLEFAGALRPDLVPWIAAEVPFPSTMVDRITPATQPSDLDGLATREGYRDDAAVVHEPFRQWVIEDRFAGARPAWCG